MEAAAAKVIPWNSKPGVARERNPVPAETAGGPAEISLRVEALDRIVVMIPDEQLDALGTLFSASPLRKAMTFEGYLVVKGYGQPAQ